MTCGQLPDTGLKRGEIFISIKRAFPCNGDDIILHVPVQARRLLQADQSQWRVSFRTDHWRPQAIAYLEAWANVISGIRQDIYTMPVSGERDSRTHLEVSLRHFGARTFYQSKVVP